MGSSQSSLKTEELIPLFIPDELASYDISNSKKELYKNSIQLLLAKFQFEYKNFYYKRKADTSNLTRLSINDKDLQSIRSSINILIIIGSSFQNKKIKKSVEDYQKSAEDLDIALLIRHIFINSFCIPNNQILIASTQNSNFSLTNIDKNLISTPNQIFEDIDDPDVESENYLYRIKIQKFFLLEQNINLAQVNDYQFKFYLDENIQNIVIPFNIKIIQNKLPKNPNLFVFLLDHEHKQKGFGSIPYQFIIERLLKIECNRFFVFNDSHHSGSIIKLIKLCEKFRDIFPDINNSTLESALFYFISNLNKVYSNDELISDNILDKFNEIDSYNVNDEIKELLKSMILKIDKSLLPKISDFIFHLGDEYKSMFCVPQHVIQFSKKATIFTSSDFDQISLTLPARKLKIAFLDVPTTRIFGSIFSSILIETFLYNLSVTTSLDTFCDHIVNKYAEYYRKYNKYIKEQNQQIEGQTFNTELPEDKEIEYFFLPKNYKKTHFYSKRKEFPNLNKIIINKDLWNVDITEVNSNEYNDVHFCVFKKYHSRLSNKKLKYGPVEDSYYMDKFMIDFKDAVDTVFEKNQIQGDFAIDIFSQANEELFRKNCPVYGEFVSLIKKDIKSSNYQAIKLLKAPMAIFFKKHPDNYEKIAEIFSQAFSQIIPYWEEYDIQY